MKIMKRSKRYNRDRMKILHSSKEISGEFRKYISMDPSSLEGQAL